MKKRYPTKKECIENIGYALAIFLTVILLALISATARAQNVRKQGNTFIEQCDSTKKSTVYETDFVYVDKDGKAYPIYLSKTGSAFIMKVSKKSGKKYRKYLPDVTNMIRNEHK